MSKTEEIFLDITVLKADKKLRREVYVKLNNKQSYLHNKSEHPNSSKKCIAYGKAQRFNKFATIKIIFIATVNDYLTR